MARSFWRSASAWRLVRWLLALLVGGLLYFGWPQRAHGLTPSETALVQSIAEDIQKARRLLAESLTALDASKQSATELSERLKESNRLASRLSAQLQLWREHSETFGDSLQALSSELGTLKRELATLTTTYNALLTLHTNYSVAVDKQIGALTRGRDVWRGVAIGGAVAAVVAVIVAVVR